MGKDISNKDRKLRIKKVFRGFGNWWKGSCEEECRAGPLLGEMEEKKRLKEHKQGHLENAR